MSHLAAVHNPFSPDTLLIRCWTLARLSSMVVQGDTVCWLRHSEKSIEWCSIAGCLGVSPEEEINAYNFSSSSAASSVFPSIFRPHRDIYSIMHIFSLLLLLPLASAAVLDARAVVTVTKQGTVITKAPSCPQASAFLKVPIIKTFCSSYLKKTTTTTATATSTVSTSAVVITTLVPSTVDVVVTSTM